jgi:hypothetical protein
MAVPPEFLIKVEKSTAGSTFGCLPATGCRRFEYGRPKPSIPVNQSSARRHVPAVYLADAILAIVAILEVREMNNLRVCNGRRGSNPTRASTFSPLLSVS